MAPPARGMTEPGQCSMTGHANPTRSDVSCPSARSASRPAAPSSPQSPLVRGIARRAPRRSQPSCCRPAGARCGRRIAGRGRRPSLTRRRWPDDFENVSAFKRVQACRSKRRLKSKIQRKLLIYHRYLAERVGFEPTVRSRIQRFSRPPRSTAPAPLQRARRRAL
jgi:hypothetical protein